MEPIDPFVVEETHLEVTAFSSQRAEQEMNRTADQQRELVGFIAAYTEDLSPEAAELGFQTFFRIYLMFQKGCGGFIQGIRGDQIEHCLDQNEALLHRLEGAHEKFVERVAKVEASRQPFVMRYMVEALIHPLGRPSPASTGEEPGHLTEDEIGALFLVLKTIIDVLDRSLETP